jgi:hypothetical protein
MRQSRRSFASLGRMSSARYGKFQGWWPPGTPS